MNINKVQLKQTLLEALKNTNSQSPISTEDLEVHGPTTQVLEVLRELVCIKEITHCTVIRENISKLVWWKTGSPSQRKDYVKRRFKLKSNNLN